MATVLLLLDLFWTYIKISMASFGGLSMIPLLSNEMLSHGWMNAEEVGDIVAIAEMTPGPLALNCASFVGQRICGLPGAIVASLGVLMPSFTLAFLVTLFFEKFKSSKKMGEAMYGVRPAALGMIIATMITLSLENYVMGGGLYWQTILIGAVGLLMLIKGKINIPITILVSAILGIILC